MSTRKSSSEKTKMSAQQAGQDMGLLIRRARLAIGESQTQLGRALGITQASMSSIERNETPPTLQHVRRIEEELGLTRGELLVAGGYVAIEQSVELAITADETLNATQKDFLRQAYRAARSISGPRARTARR